MIHAATVFPPAGFFPPTIISSKAGLRFKQRLDTDANSDDTHPPPRDGHFRGEGKQAEHPNEAGRFAAALQKNLPLATERLLAAMELLKREPTVNPGKIAAIGYCFGGGIVLAMTRSGADLDGVVSFHGTLATDTSARRGAVKAKVLVPTGAADPFVPGEQVAGFKKEMEGAGVDYTLISYPGAKHSFTNPKADENARKFKLPLAYSPAADAQSWKAMRDFLPKIFAPADAD